MEIRTETGTGPIWFVTGLEFDLLRFERTVAEFAIGTATPQDVNARFDILWSRVATIRVGAIARQLDNYSTDAAVFESLMSALEDVEHQVTSLETGDVEPALQILATFEDYNTILRELSMNVLRARSAETKKWRDNLFKISRTNFQLISGIAASLAVLFLAFGIDSIRTRKLLLDNTILLTKSEEANVAKSEFISVINHELRTPLTSIKGALSLIRSGATGEFPDQAQDLIRIADENCNRLGSLVNDLLDADKFSEGKMEYAFSKVRLSDLVRQSIEANQNYAESYGVTNREVSLDERLFVTGDEKRLMQVMNNLLSNAAKFSFEKGVVEVRLKREGCFAVVEVQDYGRGIPEHSRARIFERFQQVDSSDDRERGGTGLGLSIVKSIVEGHGGTIDYESEVDRGTTFSVRLRLIEMEEFNTELPVVFSRNHSAPSTA